MWNTRKEQTLPIGIQLKGTVAQDSSVANFSGIYSTKVPDQGICYFQIFPKFAEIFENYGA
jgi:hypothetical protein